MRKIFPWLVLVAAVASIPACIWSVEMSPEAKARKQADAERRVEESKPRKVSEANGCEVWTFKPVDRWLYFTRCGMDKTSTINSCDECRSVTSGKTTRTECTPHSMTITMAPKIATQAEKKGVTS